MKNKLDISYSIVSRGTEKYNNHGYMSVSEKVGPYKYILNIDHGIKETSLSNDFMKFKSIYGIENVAFSRFQLITALMYRKHKNEINDNIFILGLGNIGISCLFYLIDNNYKNITVYVKDITMYMTNLVSIIKKNYNIEIKIITSLEKISLYDTFIDTTGSSVILKYVFENIDFNKSIIILSTPRDESYHISPLAINRKNLTIIGGHELNGIDSEDRNKLFEKLLKINEEKKYLKEFINIYNYSSKQLEQIKNKKANFIEILKY